MSKMLSHETIIDRARRDQLAQSVEEKAQLEAEAKARLALLQHTDSNINRLSIQLEQLEGRMERWKQQSAAAKAASRGGVTRLLALIGVFLLGSILGPKLLSEWLPKWAENLTLPQLQQKEQPVAQPASHEPVKPEPASAWMAAPGVLHAVPADQTKPPQADAASAEPAPAEQKPATPSVFVAPLSPVVQAISAPAPVKSSPRVVEEIAPQATTVEKAVVVEEPVAATVNADSAPEAVTESSDQTEVELEPAAAPAVVELKEVPNEVPSVELNDEPSESQPRNNEPREEWVEPVNGQFKI